MANLQSVLVIFKDPRHNYKTSVSILSSEESLRKYFVGTTFDVGTYPTEDLQKCIDIEVTTPELDEVTKAKRWWGSLSINEQKKYKVEVLGENFPNCSVYTKEGSNILKIYQTIVAG